MKRLIAGIMTLVTAVAVWGADYTVVAAKAKVFDQPSATGYVTQNAQNQDVTVTPGMAFKVTDSEGGWDVVEYSPGLRGYIMKTIEAAPSSLGAPAPGSYKVANHPSETVTVSNDGGKWSIRSGNSLCAGAAYGKVVVFTDAQGNQAYTLVCLNGTQTVMTYSNAVTKFF